MVMRKKRTFAAVRARERRWWRDRRCARSLVRVHEDPSLGERGHSDDPVVVELPEGEGGGGVLDELRDIEVIVRAIPPEERDWMLKGAEFVRCIFSSFSLPLSLKMFGNPAAMPSRATTLHERNVHRLEHVHRALDTGILLFLHHLHSHGSSLELELEPKLERDPALAHAPPPAMPNDPETHDPHPHRKRQRRKAEQQSRRHRRPPHPACRR